MVEYLLPKQKVAGSTLNLKGDGTSKRIPCAWYTHGMADSEYR